MLYRKLKKIRTHCLIWLTHNMALPVLQRLRNEKAFPYTVFELQNFKDGTLGKDLVQFLNAKDLDLLPHYARHDIKHILLGYDTTEEGEVCLQCFMVGNKHLSFPVIATVLYGLFTMPEYYSLFKAAYKRGRKSRTISDWNWYDLLHSHTNHLRGLLHT